MQFGVFWTNGQICSSTSRLLVQEGIAPVFYEQLKKRAESIKQCDPLTEDCRMGPVVSQDQLDKILGFIEVHPEPTVLLLKTPLLLIAKCDNNCCFDYAKCQARREVADRRQAPSWHRQGLLHAALAVDATPFPPVPCAIQYVILQQEIRATLCSLCHCALLVSLPHIICYSPSALHRHSQCRMPSEEEPSIFMHCTCPSLHHLL